MCPTLMKPSTGTLIGPAPSNQQLITSEISPGHEMVIQASDLGTLIALLHLLEIHFNCAMLELNVIHRNCSSATFPVNGPQCSQAFGQATAYRWGNNRAFFGYHTWGQTILMATMWMDSVLHMDHHKHTSGHLLVVSLMKLVVILIQTSVVLVILVTLIAVLPHLWEMTISVRVLLQKAVGVHLIDSILTMHCGMVRIISTHAMNSTIHCGSTRLFLCLPLMIFMCFTDGETFSNIVVELLEVYVNRLDDQNLLKL